MKLYLYKTNDGDNVINKIKFNTLEIDINLKADTDILNPMIMLTTIVGKNFNDYNYAYIPLLNRYYLVSSISNINNRLWRLDLTCDVIETYKDDILASNARIRRNIRNGDYADISIESSVVKNSTIYSSDKGFSETETTAILSTIGG